MKFINWQNQNQLHLSVRLAKPKKKGERNLPLTSVRVCNLIGLADV